MFTKPFIPSSNMLNTMIASAMAKCDGDIEQQRLAEEARLERRALRMEEARCRAQAQARTLEYWR